ncbi:hypothetical protein HMPREF9532_00382 [Escherichia coli MS 57-2]|nr:hypothetical protein HMPREF9532_00382 [Escherichia coli MS 57-2]
MRETRHEETKTRSPGTGTSTWLSGRHRRTLKRNVSLSDAESKVTMAGRLARSHGGQGSHGLILSL